ncbi:MAG: YabP/YqfC family sporulation protein [Clostridia bacterium]|nr:YabP/YqfC family sporulation protein [Clostridia bacterium]
MERNSKPTERSQNLQNSFAEKKSTSSSVSTLQSGAKPTKQQEDKGDMHHKVELDNHSLLSVTGVKGVPTFSDKEIKVLLKDENMLVSGQNLEIKLLDLERGNLVATGFVTGLKYSSGNVETGVLSGCSNDSWCKLGWATGLLSHGICLWDYWWSCCKIAHNKTPKNKQDRACHRRPFCFGHNDFALSSFR